MKVYNVLHRLSHKHNHSFSCVNFRHFSDNIFSKDLDIITKRKIEAHWKDKVKERRFDPKNREKEKQFILSMFPYPSGTLHMGHVRVYTISDTLARFFQMKGKNVFQPMGWDAFGLPAENAAIERGVPANQWTCDNITKMKSQLNDLAFSFDWDAELTTCSPNFYQWTQYIFLKLFDAGLVYQKEALVNWDPVDETVLADEQVDEEGNSWRSGAKVEKRILKQWFIKTTYLAKNLYDGLDESNLENWDEIILMQRHWIGECNGYNFNFNLVSEDDKRNNNRFITVWTKNPEHLNKIQYLTVSPGNMLNYIERSNKKNRRLSIQAENPVNGSIIPIFVSDSVTYEEHQDVKAGIPEIFAEDNVFAVQNGIEIRQFDSMFSTKEEICNYALEKNIGGYPVSSKLKDWLISRQRYWGTPIPLVYCKNCVSPQPIPLEQLPVILPPSKQVSFRSNAISPLKTARRWVETTCPSCGGPAKRVTDTMDTFVDSSWYYLRYTDVSNKTVPFSPEVAKHLLPVDIYIGGKEHAVLHLYYARFMNHFLHSIGWVPDREPFHKLLVQGMIKGRSYTLEKSGRYVSKSEVKQVGPVTGVHKDTGEQVMIRWEKMSKSKGNGVDPETVLEEYGIDTTRLLVLDQMAPVTDKKWNPKGVLRWQVKVWQIVQDFLKLRDQQVKSIDEAKLPLDEEMMLQERNAFVKSIGYNYGYSFLFNIIVSRLYTISTALKRCSNASVRSGKQYERTLADMIIATAPIAPHFAAQLWSGISSAPYKLNTSEYNWSKSVFEQSWPVVDDYFPMKLICKVNNMMKYEFTMPTAELNLLTKEQAVERALSVEKVQKALSNCEIIKTNYTLVEDFDKIIQFVTNVSQIQPKKIENT